MSLRQTEHISTLPDSGQTVTPAAAAFGLIVAVAILAGLSAWFWDWTVDDAYITFRYAENVTEGHGAVFNVGERVEGYTNFLWMILLAGVHVLGGDIVVSAKVGGWLLAAATLAVAMMVTRHLSNDRWTLAAPAVPILLASTPSFAAWSVAGLETSLFTFLVVLAAWQFAREIRSRGRFSWSGVTLALAGLTRPEGAFVFGLLFLYAGWLALTDKSGAGRRHLVRFVSAFAIIAVPYMAWRLWSFGFLFPNTFYVKSGRGIYQLLGGVLYVTAGVRFHGGWVLLIAALLPAIWATARDRAMPFVVLIVGWQVYNVYKGTDVLPMFRFFVPILPLIYALGIVALLKACEAAGGWLERRAVQAAVVAVFLIATAGANAVVAYTSRDEPPQLAEYQMRTTYDDDEFRILATRLLAVAPASTTIAVIDAGLIPYMTRWPTIDRWGLCDVHIAHTEPKGPLGEKFDEAYVLGRRPTIIQTKVTPQMEARGLAGWAGDTELFGLAEFHRDYVRIPDKTLESFFVRRDSLASLRLSN